MPEAGIQWNELDVAVMYLMYPFLSGGHIWWQKRLHSVPGHNLTIIVHSITIQCLLLYAASSHGGRQTSMTFREAAHHSPWPQEVRSRLSVTYN